MQLLRIASLLFFCTFMSAHWSQAQTKEELMEKAEFLTSNSRYTEALGIIDKALEVAPKDAFVHYRKAETLIGLGKFRKAIGSLEKSVQLNPQFMEAFEMLGNLYSQFRKAPPAVKNYERAYAIASAKAASEESPEEKAKINSDRLRFKIEIVNILFLVNRHKFAKPHIDRALQLEPDNFDVKFMLVQYHNEMQQHEEALAIMEELIKEVPEAEGNEKYFYEIGVAYHMLGQYKKAQTEFAKIKAGRELSMIRQFQPDYYYNVAQAYFTVYAFDECEKYLEIAIALKSDYSEAYELKQKLAGVRTPKGEMIAAMEEQLKVEKDPAGLADKYKELANLYYQAELFEESINACNESLSINEKQLDVVFLKAMCEYRIKKPDEATAMLDKIVKNPSLNPSIKARFHFARGLIYKAGNNLNAAEAAFKSAYTGPYRAAARNELSLVFRKKMQGEDTVEDIEDDGSTVDMPEDNGDDE